MDEKKIERLQFYYVDESYAKFLRDNFDTRVPNIKSLNYKHDKFFIGVVLQIKGLDYFAPVSSYRQENALTFNICNSKNEIIASVRPNYMFPVVEEVVKPLPIETFHGSYKYLILEELRYCNKHRAEICGLANNIYSKRCFGDYDSREERVMYYSMCCDYKKLEYGAKEYKKNRKDVANELKKQLSEYEIKPITKSNFGKVFYEVYNTNQDYSILTEGKESTIETSIKDIDEVPPGFDIKQKIFVGIWENDKVIGVLDLIKGYPSENCLWIGLLMINGEMHCKKIGSKIVTAIQKASTIVGYTSIQIAVHENNANGMAFWRKHGFEKIRTKGNRIVMERKGKIE